MLAATKAASPALRLRRIPATADLDWLRWSTTPLRVGAGIRATLTRTTVAELSARCANATVIAAAAGCSGCRAARRAALFTGSVR